MLIYLLLHLIIKEGDMKLTLEGQQTQNKKSSLIASLVLSLIVDLPFQY